jgi:sigma-E factor negative regulatory protein RseA
MTEQLKQHLSALMDGELGRDEARFLHKRLEGDAELRADWARWHCIRDSLQGRPLQLGGADFVARVARGIEQDSAPGRSWLQGGLRWAAGAAIAASVAVVALMALPAPPQQGAGGTPLAAQPAAPAAQVVSSGLSESDLRPSLAPVAQTVSATQGMPLAPAVQIDPRVEAWLIRHNAAQAHPTRDSFVPFIPLLSPHRPVVQPVLIENREAGR